VFLIFFQFRQLVFNFISFLLASAVLVPAYAIGLGELHVQSGLGQPLQANAILLGAEVNEISHNCIRVKVETMEGVFLAQAAVSIIEIGKNKAISMSTGLRLNEPAVKIAIDISCEIQLHRDFLVLLDPPEFLPAIIKNSPNAAVKLSTPIEVVTEASQIPSISNVAPRSQRDTQKYKPGARKKTQKALEQRSVKSIKKIKLNKPKKSTADVLRLSDDMPFGPEGLKISTKLSPLLEQQISENREQIRLAQKHMAAILRGDDVNMPAKQNFDLEQKKIQKLLDEAVQIRHKNKIDDAYFDEIRKNSFSRNWVIGLASLVLGSLLIILLLFMHVRRMQNSVEISWWEQGRERKEVERRKNISEKVDVIQASYETSSHEMNDQAHDVLDSESKGAPKPVDVNEERVGLPLEDDTQLFSQNATSARTPTLEESNTSTFNFFAGSGSSVKVEEISDITQEAEFWMSVNDPQRAIEILNDQENVVHPDSPVPWLYLLDLYRLVKDKSKYDSLKDRFVILFNAHIPDFETETADVNVLQLEDYSHLIERICRLWNGNEIIPFLENLLLDDREGKRTGFELPVYRDLLLLISIAHEVEKMSTIDGVKSNSRARAHEEQSTANNMENQKVDPSLEMIAFEVIDFPKMTSLKK
jgi:pilus assembly protein FimV